MSYHTRPEASYQWHVAVELRVIDTFHILYMFGLVWISYKNVFLSFIIIKSEKQKKGKKEMF